MEGQKTKHADSTESLLEITKEAINIGYIEPKNVPPGYSTSGAITDSPLPELNTSVEVAATVEGDLTEDLIKQALSEAPQEKTADTGQSQWRNRLLALKDRLDQTFHQEIGQLTKPVNHLKSMAKSAAIDRKALVIYIAKLTAGGMALGLIAGLAFFGLPQLLAPEPAPMLKEDAPSVAKEQKQVKGEPEQKKQPQQKEEKTETPKPAESNDVPVMAEGFAEPTVDYTVESIETRELVRMLAALNYLPDSTASSSEQVRNAVYAFQKDWQLNPTGQVNVTTLSTIVNLHTFQKAQSSRW